jgi:FlgN protein
MGGRLLNDVARLLADLEQTQQAMLALFQRKRAALKRPRPDDLLDVAREETLLCERLQRHLARRRELLCAAANAGLRCGSLGEVAHRIGGPEAHSLADRMERVRANAEILRRESWMQWVVTQRASRHFADLLELLVHHGERSPTYSRKKNDNANAGALLDASA